MITQNMKEIIQRLEKNEDEFVITIPDEIAKAEGIGNGDLIKMTVHKLKK